MTLKELLRSDSALRNAMQEKSAAILEADALKARGNLPAAIRCYKRAAELEYKAFTYLEDIGLKGAAVTSLISAASCWYQADELVAARKAVHGALERSGGNDDVERVCAGLLAKIEGSLSSSAASHVSFVFRYDEFTADRVTRRQVEIKLPAGLSADELLGRAIENPGRLLTIGSPRAPQSTGDEGYPGVLRRRNPGGQS